jgi:hypothetical protein
MEWALREPMAGSPGAGNIRHPYFRGLEFFFDSPEFRCAPLRAILLCTSGALSSGSCGLKMTASGTRPTR